MSEDRLVPLSAEHEAERSGQARRARGDGRPNELQVEVGPRSVGQMLDQALEIFQRGFFRYVLCTALVYLPDRLVQNLFGEHVFSRVVVDGGEDKAIGAFLLFFGSTFFTALTNFLAFAVIAGMAFNDLHGRPVSPFSDLGNLVKRLPLFLVLVVLVTIGQMSGGILCCIGAFFTSWKLQLVVFAFLLEKLSIGASIRRGLALSSGSFWRYLGLRFAAWALILGWQSMANTPFSSSTREWMQDTTGLQGSAFDWIFVPLTAMLFAVGTAYLGIVWVVHYADQRVRLEGFDLALELDELVAANGAASSELEQ